MAAKRTGVVHRAMYDQTKKRVEELEELLVRKAINWKAERELLETHANQLRIRLDDSHAEITELRAKNEELQAVANLTDKQLLEALQEERDRREAAETTLKSIAMDLRGLVSVAMSAAGDEE